MSMFYVIWMALNAGAFTAGIHGLNPEAPIWAGMCIGVGIGWLFATLASINDRLLK